jgi:hypothetical protein
MEVEMMSVFISTHHIHIGILLYIPTHILKPIKISPVRNLWPTLQTTLAINHVLCFLLLSYVFVIFMRYKGTKQKYHIYTRKSLIIKHVLKKLISL